MPNSRFIWAAGLLLLPSLLLADEWANMATISAEPTPGYVCSGNADGKNVSIRRRPRDMRSRECRSGGILLLNCGFPVPGQQVVDGPDGMSG